jgi:hypothetical protein
MDPRDAAWETRRPAYRIHFWEQAEAALSDSVADWSSDEWRLTDVLDVHEVLAWVTGAAGHGRQFELFVENSDTSGRGLLRLAGGVPTWLD